MEWKAVRREDMAEVYIEKYTIYNIKKKKVQTKQHDFLHKTMQVSSTNLCLMGLFSSKGDAGRSTAQGETKHFLPQCWHTEKLSREHGIGAGSVCVYVCVPGKHSLNPTAYDPGWKSGIMTGTDVKTCRDRYIHTANKI